MRHALLAAAIVAAVPAAARTIGAGPGQAFAQPSRAIAAAEPGDTVLVEPGTYFDCAVWTADRITLAGNGPGVILSDKTCEEKALLVIRGDGAVIRDLTLARARVADNNGAGIRLEGQSLRLQRVQFLNNQVGLLAGAVAGGDILVQDCRFERGGTGGGQPSTALQVDTAALLRIERSVFAGARGNQVGSAATRTELLGNQIATSRLAVSVAGAELLMEDNVLELTEDSDGRQAAVLANGSTRVVLRRNRLVNHSGRPASLLLDWTTADPVLDGNMVAPGDREAASDGVWRHRGGTMLRSAKDGARGLLGDAKRLVLGR